MSEVIIREGHPEEYEQMAQVINSERPLYQTILDDHALDRLGLGTMTAKDLQKRAHERTYIIAEKEGRIIGHSSWYIKPNNVAWVSMLYIVPDYYRQGIGGRLLENIEQCAKSKGAIAIGLEAQKKADWAVNFYHKKKYKILSLQDLAQYPFIDTMQKSVTLNSHIFGKVLY